MEELARKTHAPSGFRASERDTITRAAAFLIESHGIRKILLVAHEGCSYYRKRYSTASDESIRRQQRDDLEEACRSLKKLRPEVGCRAYFARVDLGRVVFEAVP